MAEIKHSVCTTRTIVWQHVQNYNETRTRDRRVRKDVLLISERQTVGVLSNERADAYGPRPGADQHDTGKRLFVLY